MKTLEKYTEEIHSCSKCGLCQAVCPIYKITGNDCTVSRGHFIMLRGLIKGELKMSKQINHYLDLCLKCGACTKFCPSGIDVVDIVSSAKAKFFESHFFEQIKSFLAQYIVFGLGLKFLSLFAKNKKSKNFDKKVIFFGGCGSKFKGNRNIVNLLNACGVEVITPKFECCGLPFMVQGDINAYNKYTDNYLKIIEKYKNYDVVAACASCEKILSKNIEVKNIYKYIRENNLHFKLRKHTKVTFHKPCNMENFEDIEWILKNTENLEYIEMEDADLCCGLYGISNFKEYKIMNKLFSIKRKNIINTEAKIVLTTCLGCEAALTSYSFGKYKAMDLAEFLMKNT